MRVLSLFAVLLLLTGCPTDDPAVMDDTDGIENDFETDFEEADDAEFHATLDGREGFEGVSGSAVAHVSDGQTHVSAEISGAEAESTHPWHVHEGTCEAGGGIVGDAAAYPAFETDADGQASAEATINVALDSGADYHVNVHGGPGDLGTIVACGDLQVN